MPIVVDTIASATQTTALDIIKSSLRLLQVLSEDVVLTDNEANDALQCLNSIIGGAWANESLMVSHVTKESFPLIAGKNPYTIGIGGDFNTIRPIAIEAATISIRGVDFPIRPMAYDDWAMVRLKTLTVKTYADYFYLDATYPLATLYLYPIPGETSDITLYSRKPFTMFYNLTDIVDLQPGAARALKYQLAVELAPEYQASAGEDVKKLLMEAKAGIKRTNKRAITSQIDPALFADSRINRFNINRGF